MGIKLSNNAFATLAAGINSSATSITVTSGQGARFPTLSAGDYFYATLVDTSNNLEIVKCTARSTDVLTVVRAQETTTARAYSTGDRIEIRITAQTFVDATNVTPTDVSDEANTSTGYFQLPAGTTAQRPASPVAGMIRYNTTILSNEIYQSGGWQTFVFSYSIDYLIVAGGGAGGFDRGGGGGAGGLVTGSATVITGDSAVATIGAGATSNTTYANPVRGGDSSLGGFTTAVGGGGGISADSGVTANQNGGSGGGGSGSTGLAGGSATSGQGSAGGTAIYAGPNYGAGGGGGFSAVGGNGTTTVAGNGGAGSNWQSLGTFYAGGGGGGTYQAGTPGTGGTGGGGAGGAGGSGNQGVAGTANTGGGGGGGSGSPAIRGGNGGSGIVIVRYLGSQRGSGGTVTSAGGYTYHTFTSSGTYTP